MTDNQYFQKKREEQNEFWLLQTIESHLKRDFYNHKGVKKELATQLKLMNQNKTTPFEAAYQLIMLEKEI